jgi:hypothetical protein
MSELSQAACSITRTQRGKFFWAAWWTAQPTGLPFRKPDACNGGATSFEDALAQAQASAGRTLTLVEPGWARAVIRVLRGQSAWVSGPHEVRGKRRPQKEAAAVTGPSSIWSVLDVPTDATVTQIKAAFRAKAKLLHPDQGGDETAFRALREAYARALERRSKSDKRPKARTKSE